MEQARGYCNLHDGPHDAEAAEIVIVPVPYDGTSTWIKGADKGPEALIEASWSLELYDIETDSEVCRRGIHTDQPVAENRSPEAMAAAVKARVGGWLDKGKFPVVIGGEHSVSIGAIQAVAERHRNLTFLQLDAHSDLRPEYEGSQYNHACVMARARQLGPIVQVGIRSMDASERPVTDENATFFAEQIQDNTDWIASAIGRLSENVYITIDLDVFDPAIMPSTGTPEPGGLFWYKALTLLKAVVQNRNVVGFDVVELCPNEHNKGPDFLAAKLVYKLLSYRFQK
ncbi:MAG: agmatinase [Phycisphaerae bacterium]|nr:agmatinase [Phycisphaerae bacterium]